MSMKMVIIKRESQKKAVSIDLLKIKLQMFGFFAYLV